MLLCLLRGFDSSFDAVIPAARTLGGCMQRTGITIGRMIADAQKVHRAAEKHWSDLKPFGAKEAELKDFAKTIEQSAKAALAVSEEPVSLEDRRTELKDLLGAYRTSAEIVCNAFKGRDVRLERELRVGNTFPNNDVKLRAYVEGLETVIRKQSAKLAERGFGKAEQGQLAQAIVDFTQALASRGKDRGEARAARMSRDAALDKLRFETAYFRRIGRAALKQDAARAEFDRVAAQPRKKMQPVPAPAAKSVA
jgi:hypothetical protein